MTVFKLSKHKDNDFCHSPLLIYNNITITCIKNGAKNNFCWQNVCTFVKSTNAKNTHTLMKTKKINLLIACWALFAAITPLRAQQWNLQQCLNHALENNIQLQQSRLQEEQGAVDLWKAKGQLFPSLSFNTNHSVGYRPFEESTAIVQNGQVTTTTNTVTYQGSYGLNANVTLWNGGINQKNIEAQELQNRINTLGTQQSEQTLQEQIARLYVQILYSREAVEVNRRMEETALSQYQRAQTMMEQGQMSRADVKQMEAQWRTAQYDVVNGETAVANYKRQLKALLQLPMEQEFDISSLPPTEELVLQPLPSKDATLQAALQSRPEIQSAELAIDAADLQLDIAKRGFLPTIGLSASLGDSHYSGSQKDYSEQLKLNLNMSAGVTVSVPIFDKRQNRANVKRAQLNQLNSRLDLQDKHTTLGSTIEQLWLNANSSQQKYLAAKAKTNSQQESYNLLDEQYRNGLKNAVDVLQGRDLLLTAKQDELQSKYTALLNLQLLNFYSGAPLTM